MKEYLVKLGFKEKDIEGLFTINPSLEEYDSKKAEKNIELLKAIGCSDLYIKDIIASNSYFLSNEEEDTKELMNYLKEKLKFENLDLLFDSNSYLLNLKKEYLEEFVNEKRKKQVPLEKIRDLIELNLFIMDSEE